MDNNEEATIRRLKRIHNAETMDRLYQVWLDKNGSIQWPGAETREEFFNNYGWTYLEFWNKINDL